MNKDIVNLESELSLITKELDNKNHVLSNLIFQEQSKIQELRKNERLLNHYGDYDNLRETVSEQEREHDKIKQSLQKALIDRDKVQVKYDIIKNQITAINDQKRRESEEATRVKIKRKEQRERRNQRKELEKEKSKEQEKYQSIWLQIKQNYSSDLFNELLQIHYPEHSDLIQRGQEIDFLKAILQGQDLDKIQDVEFFFADKIHLPLSEKKRHVFIVATNGSGKSEAIKYLIFQEFKHDKTGVILIDPHGDLSEQTAKLKGKDNSKLVYISLRLSNGHTPRFNPFDVDNRNPLDVERQAKDMVLALAEIVGTSFSEYMERILFSCIYLLMMQGNKTISDLADMMRDSEVERVQRIAKSLPNERVRAFFEHDFNNKQFEGTKHSINQKLGNLVDETPFRELTTGKSTFDLKKCVNEGYKVIFDLSGLSKEAKNAYGRMVISQLHFLAYSRENSQHRPSVFVYVDEFQRFVSNTINEGLAELRKYGFHFVLATQNLTNLDTKTEKNVLSNTNIKIVGMNDYNTNNKMSKELRMDSEDLDTLEKGKFYIRAGTGHAHLVTVPSNLIDNKANMSRSKWEQVRAEQLSNYYEKLNTPPTATAEPIEPKRPIEPTGEQNDPLREFSKPSSIKPSEMDI